MLSLEEIKKSYSGNLHKYSRGLLREYLQYLILDILYSHSLSDKLIFIGGTCLRIVYGVDRFSEDLDFDNRSLTKKEFEELCNYIKDQIIQRGYDVNIKFVFKNSFHCYFKFPKLLFENDLSDMQTEIINIHVDTNDQGYDYKHDMYILNKFNIFRQIQVAPKSIILSQKLWTITQRERAKGRDFYDILILLKNTEPDIGFLSYKFGSSDLNVIKEKILEGIKDIDFDDMARDVKVFLINPDDGEKIKLFKEYIKQELFVK
jgi:predicted nucleotidyltransferase component of viral defense system